MKRQKELEKKIIENDKKKDGDDPNISIEQMKDGPAKLKKLKDTLKTPFTDT